MLCGRILRVPELHLSTDDTKTILNAVPVVAARYARHYSSCGRRAPKCKIVCNMSKGPNDGFFELVINTKNRAGVAQKTPLVIDGGIHFDEQRAEQLAEDADMEPTAKKFKTYLDSCLGKAAVSAVGANGPFEKDRH